MLTLYFRILFLSRFHDTRTRPYVDLKFTLFAISILFFMQIHICQCVWGLSASHTTIKTLNAHANIDTEASSRLVKISVPQRVIELSSQPTGSIPVSNSLSPRSISIQLWIHDIRIVNSNRFVLRPEGQERGEWGCKGVCFVLMPPGMALYKCLNCTRS